MEADLKLTGNRYSVALLVFFIGYLLGEVPSNMILSRSRPSLYLPCIMLVWGVVGGLFSLVQSYHGLVVARFFLVSEEFPVSSRRMLMASRVALRFVRALTNRPPKLTTSIRFRVASSLGAVYNVHAVARLLSLFQRAFLFVQLVPQS